MNHIEEFNNKLEGSEMRFSELEGRLDAIIQNVAWWNKTIENKDRHWGYSEKGLTDIYIVRDPKREKNRAQAIPKVTMDETSSELRHHPQI